MKITRLDTRFHAKASERYVDVRFKYGDSVHFDTSVPVEYRRTGTHIPDDKIDSYLKQVYEEVRPEKWPEWRSKQLAFWAKKPKANTTRSFFDKLQEEFAWCCASCTLPKNANFARRIQGIKELGYTLATQTNRECKNCDQKTTQLILVPLPRGGITGYEVWSPELRDRIIAVLGSFDAYEARRSPKDGLLPDHKFPEIRWDLQTRRDSLEALTDEQLQEDFQLLSNQRNQQKREACRGCFQTGRRGVVYGIPFFYEGSAEWDPQVAKQGVDARRGCVGCGWYDLNRWRLELRKRLERESDVAEE